jgi:hypothetical protein
MLYTGRAVSESALPIEPAQIHPTKIDWKLFAYSVCGQATPRCETLSVGPRRYGVAHRHNSRLAPPAIIPFAG